MIHIEVHKSNLCSKSQYFQPPHRASPQHMSWDLPEHEDPDQPAGPPIYSWGTEIVGGVA